jgi:AbrB family looped-hinge helix DNA binding protein
MLLYELLWREYEFIPMPFHLDVVARNKPELVVQLFRNHHLSAGTNLQVTIPAEVREAVPLAVGDILIITRDDDLLSLRQYEGIIMIMPEAFMGLLREQGRLQ